MLDKGVEGKWGYKPPTYQTCKPLADSPGMCGGSCNPALLNPENDCKPEGFQTECKAKAGAVGRGMR